MKPNIIARGAEAVISLEKNNIIKNRIPKGYRHPLLDKKLRKRRTKAETKLITKANSLIPTPKLLNPTNKKSHRSPSVSEQFSIQMQYIKGKKLSDYLDKLPNYITICNQIGKNIALLHNAGIIHGDLTTSNMILKNNEVNFIDFGLGFHSDRIEDKAVDLHLIKQALEARHHKIHEKAFSAIIQAYKKHSTNAKEILNRLEKVEKRGRYKQQY
jgi:Kae1-associated kinase Bud32